jgi:hypothetical protein
MLKVIANAPQPGITAGIADGDTTTGRFNIGIDYAEFDGDGYAADGRRTHRQA